jgi:phenylalanyl-tRNA synthetase beta chain
MVLDHHSNF